MSNQTSAIIDLSNKEPDCREWQELERYVWEYVNQLVRENMVLEKAPGDRETERRLPIHDIGNGNPKRQQEMELIRQGLERYRTESPDSNIRKGINWLLQRHTSWERFMQSDPLFRKRHNALVLKYIISHPMTHTAIEKRLGISDNSYKNQLEKGIRELAQILFEYIE